MLPFTLAYLSCQFLDPFMTSTSFPQVSNSWSPAIILPHYFLWHHCINSSPWRRPVKWPPTSSQSTPPLPPTFTAFFAQKVLFCIFIQAAEHSWRKQCNRAKQSVVFVFFGEGRVEGFCLLFLFLFSGGWGLQVLLNFREDWWFRQTQTILNFFFKIPSMWAIF